jgi:5-aminopentanamidase
MRAGFLQYNVVPGDKAANRAKVKSLLGNEQFDLLVLPELAFTGYLMHTRPRAVTLSEEFDRGESFDFIHRLATEHGGAIVFGFVERAGDKIHNSAALVTPDGAVALYRKTHLFDLEKLWFDPGDTGFNVCRFRGFAIGLMICFDWRFPEAARSLALKGADVICHPSNLVLPHCQDAMVTRCLENGIFAITCNRIGREQYRETCLDFTGAGQITSPTGEILRRAGQDVEELALVHFDPLAARNKSVNERNDLMADRRPDLYSN